MIFPYNTLCCFSQPQTISSHAWIEDLAEDLMESPRDNQSCLPHPFSSPLICLKNSSSLELPGLPSLSPQLKESLHLNIESSKIVSWRIVGLISFVSYLSGITVFSCLIFSNLKTIVSYNCPVCFRWKGKSGTCIHWRPCKILCMEDPINA